MVEYYKNILIRFMKLYLKFNLINILTFYIFGVLYCQIIEIFFHIKLTETIFIISAVLIFFGMLKSKIKVCCGLLIVCAIACIYLIYYYKLKETFSYVYPPLIIAILLPILKSNKSNIINKSQLDIISYLSLIYLVLNLLLYMIKFAPSFQMADKLQFKGVLPHTNMLCSILICLFIFNLIGRGYLRFFNRFLSMILIISAGSRTYIVAVILLILVRFFTAYGKRLPIDLKLYIYSFVLLFLIPFVVTVMIKFVPGMERFIKLGFSGNGRQYLTESYFNAIKNASFTDYLFGLNLAKNYSSTVNNEFAHSFTENSFVGIFLLFGIVGVLYFSYYLVRFILKSKNFITLSTVSIILITFFVQDVLLSVQTGVTTVFAVYLISLLSRQQVENIKTFPSRTSIVFLG